ncbi:hypothetical protein ONS95_007169 [Cadophora gregata]|uniref:uncharacterized protein n=1 Tax=Cadophora gregata TaxID=51156 RepID=UPI0026DD5F9D|nr:uncharacterized protein ONS95_007169 [Cadophora gregata]KAK0100718.1 hypothetical protein ONS95_007169 [Cadophora gregata]KAK0117285.1 hypothetical protein ONS96_013118 [Cadophora gregata f. sp. sojae]
MSRELDTYVAPKPEPPQPGHPALSTQLLYQGLRFDVLRLLLPFVSHLFFRFMLFVMLYVFSVPHLLKDADCIRLVKLIPVYWVLNILVRQSMRMVVLVSYSSRVLGITLLLGLVIGGLGFGWNFILRKRLHLRFTWPQWIAMFGMAWLLVGVDLGGGAGGGGDPGFGFMMLGAILRPYGG